MLAGSPRPRLAAPFALVVLALTGCAVGESGGEQARILRVIDGDTIDVRLADGARERVRLVGIDTPEKTTLRSGRAECGGVEATRATEAMARRFPEVSITADPGQDAVDQYGRLLAYVAPADDAGTTFQEALLAQGWAKVYVFRGDPFERVDAFRGAAARARAARVGVWQACGGDFRRPLEG